MAIKDGNKSQEVRPNGKGLRSIILMAALLSLLVVGCSSNGASQYNLTMPESVDDGLTVGTLDEVNIDAFLIAEAAEGIEGGRYGEVHSLLIYKDGKLVAEEYFSGHDYQWDGPNFHGAVINWDRDAKHIIHSAGKSVTSACIGIAIDEGFIESVDQSIFDYLPDHQHLNVAGKDQITIEHLLTMSSGLEWDEWGTSYASEENDVVALWVDCDDPIACILEKPLVSEPGTSFTYSGGNMIVLGEIIKNATGMDIEAFSADYLFKPMGIEPVEWSWINDDVLYAGGDQKMTSREMLKFGVTYLNQGVWDGQQIVSSQWVEHSATPYAGPGNSWFNSFLRPIPPGNSVWGQRGYSYSWWTHQFTESGEEMPGYWAGGWGGQYIIVFPEQNAVVVFTGGNYTSAPTGFKILTSYILPAFQ
ncbi:MAG: serine hydrolase [Ardenticatenaceae bacterium]|nr:serine hydrolase [Ardenticatenaceae bacterium]